MDDKKILISLIVTVIITTLCGCSPAPMLQSPRVKTNISCGISGMWDKHNGDGESCYDIRPLSLKFGFFDRVDVSGTYKPFNHYFKAGNIKIFIGEHGKPSLFKNVSYALFGGIKAFGSSFYDERNVYAGAIFATRQAFRKSEIELILQPSYFNMAYEWIGERPEGRQPKSKADGMQINFGTIYTPYNSQRINLELTLGAMYRYTKNNEFKMYYNESQILVGKDLSLYNKWVIQGGAIINLKFKRERQGSVN